MRYFFSLITLFALTHSASAAEFRLSSPQVKDGGTLTNDQVFNSFGCTGANVSPELSWSGAPKETKSFAVNVYDPDAPTGSGWWHWVLVNLPATTTTVPLGAGDPTKNLLPTGALQTQTDFGAPGFGGACPPQGDKPHRYIFTVYALKVESLPLDAKASGALAGYYINANTIAKASITATWGR